MEDIQYRILFVVFNSMIINASCLVRGFIKKSDFGFRSREGSDTGARSKIECASMCFARSCSHYYYNAEAELCNMDTNYAVSPISDPQDGWSYYADSREATNIALNRTATQSSTYGNVLFYHDHGAHLAVDGIIANITGGLSCTHTSLENKPWLEIELGTIYQIDSVVLFNRQDTLGERLQYFSVDVFHNTESKLCGFFNYESKTGETISVLCQGKPEGTAIRIMLEQEGYLSLSEVEVYSLI